MLTGWERPTMEPKPITMDGDPREWLLEDRPVIYVAGYFSANPMHGTANAVKAAEKLLDAGWLPYVPHVNLIWDIAAPHTPNFWYAYDLGMLKRCDAMYVCSDSLTPDSTGVNDEIVACTKYGIPVFYEIVEAKDRYET